MVALALAGQEERLQPEALHRVGAAVLFCMLCKSHCCLSHFKNLWVRALCSARSILQWWAGKIPSVQRVALAIHGDYSVTTTEGEEHPLTYQIRPLACGLFFFFRWFSSQCCFGPIFLFAFCCGTVVSCCLLPP